MNIITVSREFGSGGRELGKRLADLLEYDYYDTQVITAIAKRQGLDAGYVEEMIENHGWQSIPITTRRSFALSNARQAEKVALLLEQKRVIESIARLGKNCVIVGRNADVLLQEYRPFNLFVCADMPTKLHRCIQRAQEQENLSPKEMERKIHSIDRGRIATREILADSRWGDPKAYELVVNTTHWNIKELTPAVAAFATSWFGRK